MATTTITYVSALTSVLNFAKDNGFDNEEVITKVQKLIDQKGKGKTPNGKSQARKANEKLAEVLADTMRSHNLFTFDNKHVREYVEGINTAAKATAVLNVAVDMGLVERQIVAKSATRNEIMYTLIG